MAGPQYVRRSYGGEAGVAQLVNGIGASDTTFTISPTTGWIETVGSNIGSPLGTSGPFTVVIDRFTAQVEKILCSAINTSTGVVTVYTSTGFTGRGYDGTTPQAHVPNGSTAGVQTCFSAVEAEEANQAVLYGPGGGGSLIGLTGNPAGRVHAVTGTLGMSTANILLSVATDFLKGGMTASTHGLVVPATGYYQVNSHSWFVMGGANSQAQLYLYKTTSGTPSAISSGDVEQVSSGVAFSLGLGDVVALTANDILEVRAISSVSNASMVNLNNTSYNYLSASLVSK